jgi:branched-chain amino acid transport system permease protein
MAVTPILVIQSILNGLLLGGIYALIASGFSLCFGVARQSNTAHAAFAVLGAFMSYWLYNLYGLDPLLFIGIPMVILFIIGVLFQRFVLSRLMESPPLASFVLCFFTGIVVENLMVLAWKNQFRSIITPYSIGFINIGGIFIPNIRIITFIIAIIALLILILIVKNTNFGKTLRATAQNRQAAMLVGINVKRIYMLTYGLALALASAAGTLMGLNYTFYPGVQSLWIGKIIIISIFGGLGSLRGTLVAALIIGMADVTIGVYIPTMWGSIISWLILLIVAVVRPQRFLGASDK